MTGACTANRFAMTGMRILYVTAQFHPYTVVTTPAAEWNTELAQNLTVFGVDVVTVTPARQGSSTHDDTYVRVEDVAGCRAMVYEHGDRLTVVKIKLPDDRMEELDATVNDYHHPEAGRSGVLVPSALSLFSDTALAVPELLQFQPNVVIIDGSAMGLVAGYLYSKYLQSAWFEGARGFLIKDEVVPQIYYPNTALDGTTLRERVRSSFETRKGIHLLSGAYTLMGRMSAHDHLNAIAMCKAMFDTISRSTP